MLTRWISGYFCLEYNEHCLKLTNQAQKSSLVSFQPAWKCQPESWFKLFIEENGSDRFNGEIGYCEIENSNGGACENVRLNLNINTFIAQYYIINVKVG